MRRREKKRRCGARDGAGRADGAATSSCALVAALSSHRCEFIAVKSVGADLDQLAGWIRDGMQVPIDARFPVRDLAAALDRLGKGEVRGRVAVQVEGGF